MKPALGAGDTHSERAERTDTDSLRRISQLPAPSSRRAESDCTAVDLASQGGGVLGDVGEPGQVWGGPGEVPLDVVVENSWPRPLPGPAPALRTVVDRSRCCEHSRQTRRSPARQAGTLELVGQEPVAELGVVRVGVDQRVGQIGVFDPRGLTGLVSHA